MREPLRYLTRSSGLLILAGFSLVLALSLFGFAIIQAEIKHAEADTHAELATISGMKAQTIADWARERRSDAEVAMHNYLLASYLSPGSVTGKASRDDVISWMRSFQTSYKYKALFLLSRTGEPLLTVPESAVLSSFSRDENLVPALNASGPLWTDLFVDPETGNKTLEFWIPVRNNPGDPALGALVLQIDPQTYLYPLIQSWPVSSKTAESLITRRIGDDVIFLNDLRHVPDAALNLTISVNQQDIPAVRAARGFEGIVQGPDYRGVPVVASITPVSGTPWYLVAKVDAEEVYEPIHIFFYQVAGTLLLFLLLGTLTLLFIWRSRENEFLVREIGQKNHELYLSDRIGLLMQEANDAIFILDEGWHILEANERAVEWFGYSPEEFRQMVLFDLRSEEGKSRVSEDLQRLGEKDGVVFITEDQRKDGTVFAVEDSVRMIMIQGIMYRQAIIHDISEHKALETELEEKNLALLSMNEKLSASYEELASQEEELRDQFEMIRRSEQQLMEVHSRLSKAQRAGHVGVWEYSLSTRKIWGSEECFTIYGLDQPADGIRDISDVLACIQNPGQITTAIADVIGKNVLFDEEFVIHPADGSPDRIVLSIGELSRDEDGNPVKITGIVQDVTEKRRLESDIRKYQERAAALFNSPVIGTLIGDIYGSVFQANDEFLRIIGYDRGECEAGRIRWTDLTPPEFQALDEKSIAEAREKGNCTPYEKQYIRKDGSRIWVLVGFVLLEPERTETAAFILDLSLQKENEEKIRLINQTLEERVEERTVQLSFINEELQSEVQERMAAEKNLQKILSVLSATIESTPEGILVLGGTGTVPVYNKRFVEMLQIPESVLRAGDEDAIIGMIADQVAESASFRERMVAISSEPEKDTSDTLILADGRIIELYSKPQRIGYAIAGRVYSFHDVTAKKEMERRIERSLREKEILLKEIHHRVKNNMQVVSSLLFMQSRLSDDPHLKEILLESQNRVKSIALVHEELYQSMDLDRIDYPRYLQKISRTIFETYKVDSSRISLKLPEKSEYLTISKAVPCSLIVNELISNSLKHAFPDFRKGTIFIEFTLQDGIYRLVYGDDGIGIPDTVTSHAPKTLGLELVKGLVRQLNGSVQIEREGGTRYEISFPE